MMRQKLLIGFCGDRMAQLFIFQQMLCLLRRVARFRQRIKAQFPGASRHIVSTMDDWKKFLQQYLATMDYELCDTAGKVTQEEARDKAYREYEKYKLIQDKSYISDFDRFNEGNDETPLLPFDIDPKE